MATAYCQDHSHQYIFKTIIKHEEPKKITSHLPTHNSHNAINPSSFSPQKSSDDSETQFIFPERNIHAPAEPAPVYENQPASVQTPLFIPHVPTRPLPIAPVRYVPVTNAKIVPVNIAPIRISHVQHIPVVQHVVQPLVHYEKSHHIEDHSNEETHHEHHEDYYVSNN